ncbi:MAG: hypothetical protein FWG99_01160 [Treponema sp.]|nr:hypothetical protein [Treponema sp.]
MKHFFTLIVLLAICSGLPAQTQTDALLPLKRVVILSSGLAYYEHSGTLNGQSVLSLPFRTGSINDALKSLVVNDPASANPSVTYQSEQTLLETLRSLKIDLSDSPDLPRILSRLRGAEVEITAPSVFSGRIVGIEYRSSVVSPGSQTNEPWLLLNTSSGMRLFSLKEINSINFREPGMNQDLNRALDLISESRNTNTRNLLINLNGSGSRQASISYVVPSPVWKVSYRLDLGAASPLFQGWAIVDNDSDTDWHEVELSLVAGRPASFIQNLYPPYYVSRPVVPLSIAGTAPAATHDYGYAAMPEAEIAMPSVSAARARASSSYDMAAEEYAPAPMAQALAGGAVETARGGAAGDQFEFTIKRPISLDRRMSAMLPLVESGINARKVLIFSGSGAAGRTTNPRLGAEITNSSGMKLPAGPITVYDGGVYAGDALIEFWNENEKRLISYGEDLSVTGVITQSNTRAVSSVNISGGVMTINRSLTHIKSYVFRNTGNVSKQLVVEHPKTPSANLVAPEADEQTPSSYRFNMTLGADRELMVNVSEMQPISERITLLSVRPDTILSYSTSQEIPQNVRTALRRAVELRQAIETAETAERDLEGRRTRLAAEQERIRRNLEAAGNQTQQGQEYLRRLVSIDNDIDRLAPEIEKARADTRTAQRAYENYLNGLNL